jgi:hypothetical protein
VLKSQRPLEGGISIGLDVWVAASFASDQEVLLCPV